MSTRDVVLRGLGKKQASFALNFELLDQADDAMDSISRESDDVELLEQALREGRENTNIGAMGGLKLRQAGSEVGRLIPVAGNSGFRREAGDSTGTHFKPRLIHAVFLICVLTLVAISMFSLFDSITVVEVAYKVHALAGLVSNNAEPLEGRRERWRATGFMLEDTQKNPTPDISEVAVQDSSKGWVQYPTTANDAETLSRQIEDTRCRENSTSWAQTFGLPTPDKDDVIHLPTGFIHKLRLVSLDSFGNRRCAGGDYYETDLRSPHWKSRPPVLDLGNGSYEVELQVDPHFAGRFVLKVVLLFSNFDGLMQLDPRLSAYEYKKHVQDKLVASFDMEFELPPRMPAAQILSPKVPNPQEFDGSHMVGDMTTAIGSRSELRTCKGEDFSLRQWSGRWTRGGFNPNCSVDSENNGRLKCLDPETKCEQPWCEGAVGRLESNGWVYSAHCAFKVLSRDEAWQCLDGKWLFWWSNSDDHENTLIRDLLRSVLGLTLPEGRWDGLGRFSNKVFVRPDRTETSSVNHPKTASLRARNLKQQVRMTNMWNANIESNPDHFQGVLSSYFTKFSSPDIVIMNSGLHEGTHWHNWKEFVDVGVQNSTSCWKETFEAILPSRHPRMVFTTTGAQSLSDFNPQVMEMYTRFLLNAYVKANLTSDFRIVDGFDYSFSWMGRYKGSQHFVDLMLVHMLLTAICADH